MPAHEETTYFHPYYTYEAPVNEATLKLREKLKIDPETGYPEKYNWRGLAKLGYQYEPEKPFLVFKPYTEEQLHGTKATLLLVSSAFGVLSQAVTNYYKARKFFAHPYIFLLSTAAAYGVGIFTISKSNKRQTYKNALFVDYMKKHPERFGTIRRYKYREVVFPHSPNH